MRITLKNKRVLGDGTCLYCLKDSPYFTCDACHKKRSIKELKQTLKLYLIPLAFGFGLTFMWQGYEKIVYGELKPDMFHTFIVLLLALMVAIIQRQKIKIEKEQKAIKSLKRQNEKTNRNISKFISYMQTHDEKTLKPDSNNYNSTKGEK